MKHLIQSTLSASILLAAVACGSTERSTNPPSTTTVDMQGNGRNQNKKPVWSDEFHGNKLNLNNWGHQIGNGFMAGDQFIPGWGNNEIQYYTDRPDNVRVEKGHLVITAKREQYTGDAGGTPGTFNWTSGRIRTAGKFSRTYGRFEIRAKLPTGKGLWPAIWMLPEEPNEYGHWAASGEIDIAEGWGSKPDKLAQTIHYGGNWPNNVYSGQEFTFPEGSSVGEWHTYTLEWLPGEIRWYVDGQLTSTKTQWWSSSKNPPQSDADLNAWPAPFDRPFHLLLNLAVGGNFDGNPDATTPDENHMLVDYVRVYSHPEENRDPGPRPDMTYPWTPRPARPALPDGNLVYNGSFDWPAGHELITPDTTTLEGVPSSYFWTTYHGNDGASRLSNDTANGNSLKVDITNPGSVNYAVQVRQDGLNIMNLKRYEVTFDAWATTPRTMMVKVGGGPDRGYAAYSGERLVTLGTTAGQQHTITFDMLGTTDAAARLEFNLGNAGSNTVWIDNVSIREAGTSPVRQPRPDGNLIYNGNFSEDDPTTPGIDGVPNTDYWAFWENGRNGVNITTENNALKLSVAHVDPANDWHIQLLQKNVPVVSGQTYTLSFTASSSSERTVTAVIGEDGGSYARYLSQAVHLTTTPQTFEYTFTPTTTNYAAQLQLLLATGAPGSAYDVTIRDVRLVRR